MNMPSRVSELVYDESAANFSLDGSFSSPVGQLSHNLNENLIMSSPCHNLPTRLVPANLNFDSDADVCGATPVKFSRSNSVSVASVLDIEENQLNRRSIKRCLSENQKPTRRAVFGDLSNARRSLDGVEVMKASLELDEVSPLKDENLRPSHSSPFEG